MELFSDHFEFYFYRNFFVKFDVGFVVSELFDGIVTNKSDLAAVNRYTCFFVGIGQHNGVHRSEDLTVLTGFGTDPDHLGRNFLGQCFGIFEDLGFFVCTLTKVLGMYFTVRFGSHYRNSLGYQEVTGITRTYFNDLVFRTQVLNFFFQNYF